ncbi:hypothetical protein YC2023_038126 [Brassica napus]
MAMSMGFLFLVMAVVARTAATPPVLTVMSPDGDIVDCININEQPAFDHPLLRNHTVLEAPAYLPDIDDTSWQSTRTTIGAKATFNVWRPKVEQATEFSLAQIWIISDSYDNNTLNSIEAGWQLNRWSPKSATLSYVEFREENISSFRHRSSTVRGNN